MAFPALAKAQWHSVCIKHDERFTEDDFAKTLHEAKLLFPEVKILKNN
jgi:hypothetical protein